ncbi:SRPBCC domain-containing protein [Nocardiopsis tropica]|uniref:SRPBCC domain-containing protein n=1 Tax=Nocardiopsis tropica TaxID=109330 RepID=A0ABU7KRU7_9ACTN|nr:SRPBCC domain-containing protein [Nocardiopsis umidischolae]MEE2052025.1 SRPBCC domain-containing protein [Nocardiopsis umidischolae]
MDEVSDRIERQVDIAAPARRVWELVSRPGWFINDGAVVDHVIEQDGDVSVVRDPVHGDFRIRTEKLDPPGYAAFRWLGGEEGGSTLVEFWIEELETGGVTLSVAESGFSSLGGTEAERRRRVEENTRGWEEELGAARSFLDASTVERSVHVGVTPERLWPVLTRPEHFAAWYAFGGAEFEAVPGAPMELRWDEHGTFRGRVVTVDEPSTFAYRIAAEPDTDPGEGVSTLVTMTVRKSGDGSLLKVVQSGFDALHARFGTVSDNVVPEEEGWAGGLAALAAHLPGAVAP